MSREKLEKIAKENNITYSRLSKLELGFVLGCKKLKECRGNKLAIA